MRLEEFPTAHKLEYTPGDIESMRKALRDYRDLVHSEEAFEDDYCKAHFYHSWEAISLEYFKDFPLAVSYLQTISFYYGEDSDTSNLQSVTTGEALFYLCAIMHKELKDDIVKSCESIVSFARKHNDSSKMWLTCEHPFGIEALSILAHVYPEYGYLLASYLIPNWDDEHMPEPLHLLAAWSRPLGITKDTIKAYCYCDNNRARENMLGYDTWDGGYDQDSVIKSDFDILTYIKGSFENYTQLLAALSDRLVELPLKGDADAFVKSRIVEMMFVHQPFEEWDDNFDIDEYLTNTFIDGPADEALVSMTEAIEDMLGRPIHEEVKHASPSRVVVTSETAKWKDLITKIHENGHALWKYVMEGGESDIIRDLSPMDIVARAKAEGCILAESLDSSARYSPLHERIDSIIRRFMGERLSIDTRYDKGAAKEEILRLYDLLHIFMDKPVIYSHLVWLMTEHFAICTRDEVLKRYPSQWCKKFNKSIALIHRFDSLNDQEGQTLDDFYRLVNQDREKSYESLKEHLHVDLSHGINDSSRLSKVPTQRCYAILASYIQRRDHEEGINDILTQDCISYLEGYLPEFTLNAMSDGGVWANRPQAMSVKDKVYEAEYQIKYQQETLASYTLWQPLEAYLVEGHFNGFYGEQGYEEALHYFRHNLKVEDEEVSELQAQYDLFSHNDDTIILMNLLDMVLAVGKCKEHDLYRRSMGLLLGVAPLYVTSHLYSLQRIYDEEATKDKLMADVGRLQKLGLPDYASWIHMLIDSYKVKKKEGKASEDFNEHYDALMDLCFKEKREALVSSYTLFDDAHKKAKTAIQIGCKYLARGDYVRLLHAAKAKYGMTRQIQTLVDELALDKMKRCLQGGFVRIPVFIENLFEANNIAVTRQALDFGELEKAVIKERFEALHANVLTADEREAINAHYKLHWSDNIVYLVKNNEGYKAVYNGKLLDLLYTELLEDKELSRYGLDCRIIEDCDEVYIQAVAPLESMDYKAFWLSHFTSYLHGDISFDAVKDMLTLAVSDYEFLKSSYFDFSFGDLIMEVSHALRNRILRIVGRVDYEALDMVRDREFETYFKVLFKANVDREALLKLLVHREDIPMLETYALMTDCSIYLESLAISDLVDVLGILASIPQYHPTIIDLKKHKSKKVKDAVVSLIKKHFIESEDQVDYSLLDYGDYYFDQEEGNFLPVNEEHSADIKAQVGNYFGLRFTASNPKIAPKVTVHTVTVKHPWINEEGKKSQKTSKWVQNGYNASAIFAGWSFENQEACIPGKYTFKIIDSSKRVILEQSFNVTIN